MKTHRALSVERGEKELVRFRREMNLIGELKHPHIVRLVDSGWFAIQVDDATVVPSKQSDHPTELIRASNAPPSKPAVDVNAVTGPAPVTGGERVSVRRRLPFIVMELLRGETLFDVIARERKLPLERAVDLLLPVASALYCAHERGVVHRDLKPGNIFLNQEDHGEVRPVVLDFGIAKLLGEQTGDTEELTEDSDILGTPAYAAPEQIGRKDPIGPATDQYAWDSYSSASPPAGRPFPVVALSCSGRCYIAGCPSEPVRWGASRFRLHHASSHCAFGGCSLSERS